MRYRVAGATAYFAVLIALAHSEDRDLPGWTVLAVIFVLPLAVGFVVGLWGLFVPPLVVLFVVPAGYGSGELPIWFSMAIVAFIATPEIVIGWGAMWAVRYYARFRRDGASYGVNS